MGPLFNSLAGGGGFEPPLTGPEPVVLPLDDPPPAAHYYAEASPYLSNTGPLRHARKGPGFPKPPEDPLFPQDLHELK